MTTRRELLIALGALAVPHVVHAQQVGKVRRLAVLTVNAKSDPQIQAQFAAFVKQLQELGWKDGGNIRIEYRFGEGDATRMFQLARELLEFNPDVIFAATNPAATAVRQQTLSVPIVFAQVPDPVAAGFVTNLARPEGNITGFVNFEFSVGEKWLQTLMDFAPKVRRVAVLFDPGNPTWAAYLRPIEASASKFGVQLIPIGAKNAADLKQAINAFAKSPNGALVVFPAPVTTTQRDTIITLAAQHRLPAIYPFRYFTVNGGLMSYGVDLIELYRQAASYVDRILKGAKPADLPVQLPTKMELVINLKTAKALGLTIPQSILLRADRVIE